VFTSGSTPGTIDWASAGAKVELPDSTADVPKFSFPLTIDNRRSALLGPDHLPDPSAPPDECSFHPMANGDVLETGEMPNLDLPGHPVRPYEEVWRRLPLPGGPGGPGMACVFLESVGPTERTCVGRCGPWELGLRDGAQGFWGWRYDQQPGGTWREVHVVGGEQARAGIPRLPEEGLPGAKEGETIEWEGRTWLVKENSQ